MAVRVDELVPRLQSRDDDAFEEMVAYCAPIIGHWVRRSVPDHAEAEDLVQEVLLAAWRAAPTLRDDTALLAWLRVVTDNAVRKRARTWSRRPSVPVGLVPLEVASIAPVEVHDRVDVQTALQQMPDREADILHLLYAQDISLEDAASVMQLSPEAAKSLAARARRRFKERFTGWFRAVVFLPLRALHQLPSISPLGRAGAGAVVALGLISAAATDAPPMVPASPADARPVSPKQLADVRMAGFVVGPALLSSPRLPAARHGGPARSSSMDASRPANGVPGPAATDPGDQSKAPTAGNNDASPTHGHANGGNTPPAHDTRPTSSGRHAPASSAKAGDKPGNSSPSKGSHGGYATGPGNHGGQSNQPKGASQRPTKGASGGDHSGQGRSGGGPSNGSSGGGPSNGSSGGGPSNASSGGSSHGGGKGNGGGGHKAGGHGAGGSGAGHSSGGGRGPR